MGKKKDKHKHRHNDQPEAQLGEPAADVFGSPVEDSAAPGPAAPGPAQPPQLVNPSSLAMRLNSVSLHLLRRLQQEDAESGMTGERLSALAVLVYGGPRTLGKLAEAEGVAPPTMTRLVAAMERQGLVERSPHETDGRSIVVHATERGQQLLLRARKQRIGVLARALAMLPDRDATTLDSAAGILERLLEERLIRGS